MSAESRATATEVAQEVVQDELGRVSRRSDTQTTRNVHKRAGARFRLPNDTDICFKCILKSSLNGRDHRAGPTRR